MTSLLAVPAEMCPSQESFLLEVLSREHLGLDVAILTVTPTDQEPGGHWNAARLFSFPERLRNPVLRGFRSYVFDPRYLIHIPRVLREVEPRAVMVRDLTVPLLVAYLLQPFHGYRLIYQRTYPHEYRWYDPRLARRYKLPRLYLWCRRVENRVLHALMRRCDAVLSISDAMSEQLAREEHLRREALHTFGMGVNPRQMEEHERKGDEARTDGILRLAYSGTLGPSRELEYLLDAFALARERSESRELKLEVYGGSKEDVARLRRHASELAIENEITFTGELDRDEMLDRLSRCDLALNYIPAGPRYWVSCPTKQVEYLALGMPSVATNTVDFVQGLARRYGGIALGAPEPDSFADAIVEGCRAIHHYRAEAQRARSAVREEFSYGSMAARLEELAR